jgi:hypothetical protein
MRGHLSDDLVARPPLLSHDLLQPPGVGLIHRPFAEPWRSCRAPGDGRGLGIRGLGPIRGRHRKAGHRADPGLLLAFLPPLLWAVPVVGIIFIGGRSLQRDIPKLIDEMCRILDASATFPNPAAEPFAES